MLAGLLRAGGVDALGTVITGGGRWSQEARTACPSFGYVYRTRGKEDWQGDMIFSLGHMSICLICFVLAPDGALRRISRPESFVQDSPTRVLEPVFQSCVPILCVMDV